MKKPMTNLEVLKIMQGNLEQLEKLGIRNDKAMLPIQKAIEALEKQVPKLTIDLSGNICCPCCEGVIRGNSVETAFCSRCGQAIEWRDNV